MIALKTEDDLRAEVIEDRRPERLRAVMLRKLAIYRDTLELDPLLPIVLGELYSVNTVEELSNEQMMDFGSYLKQLFDIRDIPEHQVEEIPY